MADKLKTKYMEVLKERDVLLHDNKRVRHDYDMYVKQNDQVSVYCYYFNWFIFETKLFIQKDKFCLRNELNTTRNHLMDVEKELIASREECIKLNENINKLESDVIIFAIIILSYIFIWFMKLLNIQDFVIKKFQRINWKLAKWDHKWVK